jgi:hypothetical protein
MHVAGMRMRLLLEEFLRVFFEFREAVMTAEKISLAVMNMASRGRVRVHFHAADWINHVLSLP